jgi:hypothetical protein
MLDIERNIVDYFTSPAEPCQWAHAVGLTNSAPLNRNEERACLLRLLTNNYFPGVLKLVDSCELQGAGEECGPEEGQRQLEKLKFISKWAWKEIEMTRGKFDELCELGWRA